MSLHPPGAAQYELSLSRLIDAPRRKVFRAWTDPQLLAQWWGPNGMITPVCEMQLWVGGLFSHGDAGARRCRVSQSGGVPGNSCT